MKKFLIVGLVLFVYFIYILMIHRYEEYGFTREEVKFDRGVVVSYFIGEVYSSINLLGPYEISRSPYDLLLNVESEEGKTLKGVVYLHRLILMEKETRKILFEKTDIPGVPFEGSKAYGSYYALFRYDKIDLEYKDMDLYVEFSIVDGDKKTEHKAELSFKTDYTPRHRRTTMY